MNLINKIQVLIFDIINDNDFNKLSNLKPDDISIELSKSSKHGDLSTNIAMVLAKKLKTKPKDVALNLQKQIEKTEYVNHVEIAGPGFINIFISIEAWHNQLSEIINAGEDWGKSKIGNSKLVNVEYVSANPTGPLHVGHVRGAVLGDVIANILEFVGFKVTKEYYVNDAGIQIKNLSKSLYKRYNELFGINYY